MIAPTHSLRTGAVIPAVVLRAVLLAVMVGALSAMQAPWLWFWIGVVVAGIATIEPRTLTAWGVIGVVAIGLMLGETAPGRTAVALLAVTAIHQLGTMTLLVPLGAAIQPRALRPTIVRFLTVQLIAQPLAFVLLFGWSEPLPHGTPWAATMGAATLVVGVIAFVVLSRRRSEENPGGPAR